MQGDNEHSHFSVTPANLALLQIDLNFFKSKTFSIQLALRTEHIQCRTIKIPDRMTKLVKRYA